MLGDTLKKTEKPLVVFFRLYGDDKAALSAVAGKRRGAHNAVAMAGTMAEVARLKAKASGISTAEAKALTDYRKLTGQCPITLLRTAAKTHLSAQG